MNNNKKIHYVAWMLLAAASILPAKQAISQQANAEARRKCTSVAMRPTAFIMLGKSSVIPLEIPVSRVIVDGPPGGGMGRPDPAAMMAAARGAGAGAGGAGPDTSGIADIDVLLLSPSDLFLRGKRAGSTNVILQDSKGACFIQDVIVSIDPGTLQNKLSELMPDESGIRVKSAENAIVLTGTVADSGKLDEAMQIATAYGDGKRVVNLLRTSAPQQVMLEVKIAEVSKNLLDRFDIDFTRMFTSADGVTSKIFSGLFGGSAALIGRFSPNVGGGIVNGSAGGAASGSSASAGSTMATAGRGSTLVGVDAQTTDGLVRVLAEPNIMAINGQPASFLSGGKILIPVAQSRDAGGSMITLEEKEFGVGLKFTPTVLGGGRVNLKLTSEVSELSQTGTPFTTVGGITSVLPSISTRRVDTTVQLNDGQSFAIAGLIRNNITETLKKFPGLGDIPVLGMLFRSSEFQDDKTELIFIVTPRLVKPMTTAAVLPTEVHVPATPQQALWMGTAEGKPAGDGTSAPRK